MTLSPVTNDGPIVRWALQHAKRYLTSAKERETFDHDISIFSCRRDNGDDFDSMNREMKIDGLLAVLDMTNGQDAYEIALSIDGVWISEGYIKQNLNYNGPTVYFAMAIPGPLPQSMMDSLIGTPVEDLVQLPKVMRSILTGTMITSMAPMGNDIAINLESRPA